MVDIETTGTTSFDNNGILQIAAVKFNYDTGDIDTNFFNACLRLPTHRYWDEGTRSWWSKQKPHILKDIMANGRDHRTVIREYYDWLLLDYPHDNAEGLRFWGKPTHFDYSFLASYLNEAGLSNPCSFRFARDLNSFMAGLSGSPAHPNMEQQVEFDGDQHNALHDSIFQIKMLLAQKDRYTSCENVA